MSKLQVRKVSPMATIPTLTGATFPICATVSRFEAVLRSGNTQATAYWLNTGLQFDVPEGHVLKVYPEHDLAKNHLARLAECVAIVEPGDHSELVLRLVVDEGGKTFEPKVGMVVARAMLEQIVCPELVEVTSFDEPATGTETATSETAAAVTDETVKKAKK